MNKLDGFPNINCITLKNCSKSVKRIKNFQRWFLKYGVSSYTVNLFDKDVDINQYTFKGYFADHINDLARKIFISHFSVLRKWYESTNDPYILVFEDDISFETVKYWGFTWKDFEENLPSDCMCVQLTLIYQYESEYDLSYPFNNREPYFRGIWSACSYYMKREYVKHLLDTYNPDPNVFLLHVVDAGNIIPVLEQILFLDVQKRVYTFPLFVEDCYKLYDDLNQHPHRFLSYDNVMKWWKIKGKKLTINELIKL